MKRPLFVFAGQSNMMGAPVYDAKESEYVENTKNLVYNDVEIETED